MALSTGNYCFGLFFFLSLSIHLEVVYSTPLHLYFSPSLVVSCHLHLRQVCDLPHNVCIWYTCHRYFGVKTDMIFFFFF